MIAAQHDPPVASNEFASFWHGPLDPITYTCLASFPFQGASLRIYTYDGDLEVPEGVTLVDARQIVADETLIGRFVVNGRVSFSKFSNYFRYCLLMKADICWVDTDLICLRRPDFAADPIVVGHQRKADGPWALNGAVLKLPREHPMLAELCQRAADAEGQDSKWGVIGPLLITELARKYGVIDHARPPADFYPLHFKGFWKALLPGYRGHVERATENSTFLHLWNELYNKAGYDKRVAPVPSSFLHLWCERLETIGRFERSYDRTELRQVLGHFINE